MRYKLLTWPALLIFLLPMMSRCNLAGASKEEPITLKTGQQVFPNKIALDLSSMEHAGNIKESERKESFMHFFKDTIFQDFHRRSLSYNLENNFESWLMFEDKSHVIISGLAAKDINSAYLFTIVYKDLGNGVFENISLQIGENNIVGSYPKDIIPIKK